MRGLLSLLFPPSCVACSQVESGLRFFCAACSTTLEPISLQPSTSSGCDRCGEPGIFSSGQCPRCMRDRPPFRHARAAFVHGGAVARAIHAFKYEDRPDLARPLAELMAEQAAPFLLQAPQLVSAIPLHLRRFRERKYDQAQLLAAALARQTGRKFAPRLLRRTRDTLQQVGLLEPEREANMKDAFESDQPVVGEAVLLIDDVLTTGATARAAAAALRLAGASEVQVLTLARASQGA